MANKPQIQYINRFYTPGSEAQKVDLKPTPRKARTTLPKAAPPVEKIRIQLDPVALCSMVVAIAMLVLMAVGMIQYSTAVEEHEAVASYLTQLQDNNAVLEHEFRTGYDLEWIEEQALAIGMIPREEAMTFTVSVTIPEPEAERTWWDDAVWFMEGLFA